MAPSNTITIDFNLGAQQFTVECDGCCFGLHDDYHSAIAEAHSLSLEFGIESVVTTDRASCELELTFPGAY